MIVGQANQNQAPRRQAQQQTPTKPLVRWDDVWKSAITAGTAALNGTLIGYQQKANPRAVDVPFGWLGGFTTGISAVAMMGSWLFYQAQARRLRSAAMLGGASMFGTLLGGYLSEAIFPKAQPRFVTEEEDDDQVELGKEVNPRLTELEQERVVLRPADVGRTRVAAGHKSNSSRTRKKPNRKRQSEVDGTVTGPSRPASGYQTIKMA